MRVWSAKTELPQERFVGWLGLRRGKFCSWKTRYGKANEHNALVPRDPWLLDEEKKAILTFHARFPLEGYRRLAFLMLDQDVATRLLAAQAMRALGLLGLTTAPN